MLKRMWINQPSTLQPLHQYHGMHVLADPATGQVYLLSGTVENMLVPPNVLAPGWPLPTIEPLPAFKDTRPYWRKFEKLKRT